MKGRDSTDITSADERGRICSIYKGDDALGYLFEEIRRTKLLDVITTSAELTLRNYMVMKLEEMGLLDEDKVLKALRYVIDMPCGMDMDAYEGKDTPTDAYLKG